MTWVKDAKGIARWQGTIAPTGVELRPAPPAKPIKKPASQAQGPKAGKRPRVAQCGTRSGYVAHRRRKEIACEPCLIAERTYSRERARWRKSRPQVTDVASDRGEAA